MVIATAQDESPGAEWSDVTIKNDQRVTRVGRFFRQTKIDELPQLINVLLGQMSLVGPRPSLTEQADHLSDDDRVILSVRPGITGPATLKYRHEENLLAWVKDPAAYHRDVIYPDKVKLNKQYIQHWSFAHDLYLMLVTIRRIFTRDQGEYQPTEFEGVPSAEFSRGPCQREN
jgi:lipopolysaccharide/colanic/teichoic acid biosynthesis glycosyltransferase